MIKHKLLKDGSSIHVFYEESEYNENNPELTNFGFDILTKWKFMPELLYILIKGGELKASDRNWYRYYHFDLKSKCLTQTFKEPRAKEDTTIKTFLRDDEIKDLCKLISEKQREYRGEIIAKSEDRRQKIRETQLKNNMEKRIKVEKQPESQRKFTAQEEREGKKKMLDILFGESRHNKKQEIMINSEIPF